MVYNEMIRVAGLAVGATHPVFYTSMHLAKVWHFAVGFANLVDQTGE